MKTRNHAKSNNFKQSKVKNLATRTLFLGLVCLASFFVAYAAITGTWSTNGTQSASTTVNGVDIDWTGFVGNYNYRNGAFPATQYWTDPFNGPFGGGTSLQMRARPWGTNRTVTVTFDRPVDNPVLHVERIGERRSGTVSTSIFTLGSFSSTSPDVTVTRLSGNPAFLVNTAAKSFQRATGSTNNSRQCRNVINQGTGCGSIQFNGTGITSLTFNITWAGQNVGNTGDLLEARWSLGTSVRIRKQTVGTTGTYNFAGTNGVGSFSLNTATSNPANSAIFPVSNNSQNTSITESPSGGTALTSAICRDPAGAIVPTNLSGQTLTLSSSNYIDINQLITCTFINSASSPELSIEKSNNGPWNVGEANAEYSLEVENDVGAPTSGTIIVRDVMPAGISPAWSGTRNVTSNGVAWSCTFAGQAVTCTSTSSLNVSASSTITLPVDVDNSANTGTPLTNFASVGGGGDTFNGGNAPTPGGTCSDSDHCASNQITITNLDPSTNNVSSPTLQSTAPRTSIPALSGSDPEGSLVAFQINSLPSAASGTLFLCNGGCSPVTFGQVIPIAQASNLEFDPSNGFSGTVTFTYSAVDNLGASDSSPATYSIPIGFSFTCTSVYASASNGNRQQIYELTGSTMNPVATAPQNVGGIAISSNGNAYYDNATFSNPPLYTHDGTTQSTTGASVPGLLVGEAVDTNGDIYYIDSSRRLRRVSAGATGPATILGPITFASGDTIGPTLAYGDMTFDGNGRLYWYSSVNGSGSTYLYIVNINTRVASNAGQVGPNGATGVAFDAAGRLITTTNSGATVVAIDITSPTLASTTLGNANPRIYDMGSCAAPLFNPNLSAQKSVNNITLGQSPAALANANDVLEYTILVTNSGNLSSSSATLQDVIPVGTNYVPGSTTLNGSAIADNGGNMPFATPNAINSNGQPAGVISPGGGSATLRFRVQVDSSGFPSEIRNTASVEFVTTNNGFDAVQTADSNETITPTQLQPPDVSLLKSCTVPTDCETAPQLSGTDLTYQIQFANTGGQAASGLIVVDAVPDNSDFQIGSAASNPGSTGMTIAIEYSSDYNSGNPSLATWNYTPVSSAGGAPAGYDRLVRAVRWRVTSGQLTSITPNNIGDMSFRVRIR